MTNEQEQLITLLFIKHGGFEEVVDIWLFSDNKFSDQERNAVTAYLEDDKCVRPHNLQLVKDSQYPYITAEISLETDETDDKG